MSKWWFWTGALGGVLALLAFFGPVYGIVGGVLVLVSVTLQYLDSKPVRVELKATDWKVNGEDAVYRFKSWRARSRTHVELWLPSDDHPDRLALAIGVTEIDIRGGVYAMVSARSVPDRSVVIAK